MSAARWADRAASGSDDAEPAEHPVEADGPFDATDLDLEQTDAVGRLDFESLRVPMPDGARLQIEKLPDGRLKAVHVMVECGRLSVSALAAPKNGRLWPELADEVARSLQKDGARVRVEPGVWGREVVAWAGDAQSRFVGVDGQRWMLYGISTGPATAADEAADILRDMIRGTIVVRGSKPYPVRTVLPLSLPAHLIPLLERLEANGGPAEVDEPAEQPPEVPVRRRAATAQPPAVQPPAVQPPAAGIGRAPITPGSPHAAAVARPRIAAAAGTPAAAARAPDRPAPPPPLPAAPPPPPRPATPPPPPPPIAPPPVPPPVAPPPAPPTTAFEPPLTTMLPTPELPPPGPAWPPPPEPPRAPRAPVPPGPPDGHDPWRPDEEPVTPLIPFAPPVWQASEPADLGAPLSRPGESRPEPVPDLTGEDGVGPEQAQEPAWLSLQPPDFADDVRPGRHRAPERESGRHRRP